MNKSIFFLIAYFYISSCTYINDNTSKFFNENENAKTNVAEIAKRTAESSNKSSAFNTEIESKTRLFIESKINNSFYDLLPNWEIEFNTGVDSKSELSLSTTREIIETSGIDHTVFWQGSSLIKKYIQQLILERVIDTCQIITNGCQINIFMTTSFLMVIKGQV